MDHGQCLTEETLRDLLKCEYALVATPENDSIRVQAIVGDGETSSNLAVNLISKLRDWGPIVIDDSSLVAVPVVRDETAIGLLIGYSSKHGNFTGDDLQRLMAFSQIAVRLLEDAQGAGTTRTSFSTEELLHFSRLITIGELSACFAHEVANPLMLIRGHLRFVEESVTEDHPLRANFEVIDRASKRIEEMAKRMLDFSRKSTPRTEKCDFAEVISDAVHTALLPYAVHRRPRPPRAGVAVHCPGSLADGPGCRQPAAKRGGRHGGSKQTHSFGYRASRGKPDAGCHIRHRNRNRGRQCAAHF